MRHCPVCNNSLDASFGMVQCGHCQSVLFIDFSGNIIVGDNDSVEQADIELEKSQYIELDAKGSSPEESYIAEAAVDDSVESPVSEPEESLLEEEAFSFPPADFGTVEPSIQPEVGLASGLDASPKEFISEDKIFYQISIHGIDTSSLRRRVLEFTTDSRLGLVGKEIAGEINEGVLRIRGLNPVKASVIMNALKEFPLIIEWELYTEESSSSS